MTRSTSPTALTHTARIVGLAMLVVALAAWAFKPTAQRDRDFDLESPVPRAFGAWHVDPDVAPVPPTPDVQASVDQIYDRVLMRTYVNDRGERMMLVIAYGGDQSDSLKAHRQEVCYSAQGFAIRSVSYAHASIADRTLDLAHIDAQRGPRHEPVSYWFTMGDTVAMSRRDRLLTQIDYALRGRIPDGMLVRVSSLDDNAPNAFERQRAFLDALMRSIDPTWRARFVGARGGA